MRISTKNGSPKVTPSDRWTDALKRAKVEATVKAPHKEERSPKKRWWKAKNVVAGLHRVDESDISLGEEGEEEEEDDSDDLEKRHRQKLLETFKKWEKGCQDNGVAVVPRID